MNPLNENLHGPRTRFFLILLAIGLTACQQSPPKGPDRPATTPIGDEISLKSDRSRFDEIRKEVPEDVRRENDELALVQELLGQGEQEPGKIRAKFSKAVRDRRDKFYKDAKARRDDFNRREKSERDTFMRKIQDERENFAKRNKRARPDKRKQFFEDQDMQRKDFFARQRDARSEFESQESESRRTFEAYVTEKTNKFNGELREYTTSYYERRRALDLKKRMETKGKSESKRAAVVPSTGDDTNGAPDPDLEQFKAIPNTPATPLTRPEDQ